MGVSVARLVDILLTTPSPVERVDHTTGDSFVNNIKQDDTDEVVSPGSRRLSLSQYGTPPPGGVDVMCVEWAALQCGRKAWPYHGLPYRVSTLPY